jgi:hypothetical protein
MHVDGVTLEQFGKYPFTLLVLTGENTQPKQARIFVVTLLMMSFSFDFREERRDQADHAIQRLFELGRITAERNGGKEYDQITLDEVLRYRATVVIESAQTRRSRGALETADAVSYFHLSENQRLGFPAAR